MTDVEKKILDVLLKEWGIDTIIANLNEMVAISEKHDAIRTDKHVDYKSHEHTVKCIESHLCKECKYDYKTSIDFPCTHCGETDKCYWVAK